MFVKYSRTVNLVYAIFHKRGVCTNGEALLERLFNIEIGTVSLVNKSTLIFGPKNCISLRYRVSEREKGKMEQHERGSKG